MKSLTTLLVTLLLFFPSFINAAGIPVVDVMNNLELVNQWRQHLEQWKGTVTQYKAQLDSYKRQLATATGIRDVEGFLQQAKSLSQDLENLQKNGVSLNDLLTLNGSYNGTLDALYGKYKMFDSCDANQSKSYVDTCKQIVINRAVAVEDTTQVQQKIIRAVSDISSLASRVEMSQDAKESQDLANTLSAKSVQLNALTTQWEMGVKQADLREKMLVIQREKAFHQQQLNAQVADLNNL